MLSKFGNIEEEGASVEDGDLVVILFPAVPVSAFTPVRSQA